MEKTAAAQERTTELMSMEVDLAVKQHQSHTDRERAKAAPKLRSAGGSSGGTPKNRRKTNVAIENTGGVARSLKIEMKDPDFAPGSCVLDELLEGGKWTLNFDVPMTKVTQCGTISYDDVYGTHFVLPFEAQPELHTFKFLDQQIQQPPPQQ